MQQIDRSVLEDSLGTAIAAVASFLIAHLLRMPEDYWATISAIIVVQSTLGAALTVSWQRFAGTILGAATGALLLAFFHSNLLVFGTGVLLLGPLCALLHLKTAYRFAGVTLAITMLIPRNQSAWVIAEHRFIEVSVGIVMGLVVSAIWQIPSRQQIAKP